MQSSKSASKSGTSRSPSISSTARSTAILSAPSTAPASIEGPSSLPPLYKEALLTFLGIPTNLPSLGPPSLHTAYIKYQAVSKAQTGMKSLRSNPEWHDHLNDQGVEPDWAPIYVDLINMFVAKSQYYHGWKVPFLCAAAYPQMVAWLKNEPDCLSDQDLWGEIVKTENEYSYVDLVNWLDKKDAVKAGKKAVGVVIKSESSKRDKKKKKVEFSDSEEEEKEKKKKKKKSKKVYE